MKHLRLFKTRQEYQEEKVFLPIPSVAVIEDEVLYLGRGTSFEVNDTNVRAALVTAYGDHMTYGDIQGVSDVYGKFRGNTQITDFREFRYFESLTSIPDHCFDSCTSLTEVMLPEDIKSIGGYAFHRDSKLRRLVLPRGIDTIGTHAFDSCSDLTMMVIPKSVRIIEEYTWANCTGLERLVFTSEIPPTLISATVFSDCPNLKSIYVPPRSLELYKTMPVWKEVADKIRPSRVLAKWDFKNRVPESIGTTNIQGINACGYVPSDVPDLSMQALTAKNGAYIKVGYYPDGYAHVIENTALRIPVFSVWDMIEVSFRPGQQKYTIGGRAVTSEAAKYRATEADVKNGYVEVVIGGSMYLQTITASIDMSATDDYLGAVGYKVASWNWKEVLPSTIKNEGIEGAGISRTIHSTVDGIVMTVLGSTPDKWIKLVYYPNGYAQVNEGTCIRVPVRSTGDLVSVISYPGQHRYRIGGVDAARSETIYRVTDADVANGYVEIVGTGTSYLYSISLFYR